MTFSPRFDNDLRMRVPQLVNRLYKRVVATRVYQRYLGTRVDSLTDRISGRALKQDADYKQYLHDQIDKSYRTTKTNPIGYGANARTSYLVSQLEPFLPSPRQGVKLLCVGCRNRAELDYIESVCGVTTRGLDLFSEDARVTVGDMHRMPFGAGEFDALYSCHSLEHSYDTNIVLAEYVRVTKPGGIVTIEVPVQFEKNKTDFWDFKTAEGLIAAFGDRISKVLWSETAKNAGNSDKVAARVVVQLAT